MSSTSELHTHRFRHAYNDEDLEAYVYYCETCSADYKLGMEFGVWEGFVPILIEVEERRPNDVPL